MRSRLQPVAISCNATYYYGPFVALGDVLAPSKNASHASNVLNNPFLCRKVNVAELAFSEVECANTTTGHAAAQCVRFLEHTRNHAMLRLGVPPQRWIGPLASSPARSAAQDRLGSLLFEGLRFSLSVMLD